jgi:hypothetical protein
MQKSREELCVAVQVKWEQLECGLNRAILSFRKI